MNFIAYFNSILTKNFKDLTTRELSLIVRHKTLSAQIKDDNDAVMEKLESEYNTAKELRKNAPSTGVNNTSGQAGGAGEFVPENVTVSTLIDLSTASESYAFLALLLGKQTLSAKKITVPIIGRPGKAQVLPEAATDAQFRAVKDGVQSANTGSVEIEAKKLYNNIQISDELSTFSIIELDSLFLGRLKDGVLLAAADAIINSDHSDTIININYKGTQPSTVAGLGYTTQSRYVYDNGLRKVALAGAEGVTKMDIGLIDIEQGTEEVFALQGMVDSTSNPKKKIILMDPKTYYYLLKCQDFKDMAKNGVKSTIYEGAITNIGGSDLFVTDLIEKAGTDGLVSATPEDNVTGSILVFDLTAIQHGDYEDLKFNSEDNFAISKLLETYGYRGFANMQGKDNKTFVAIGYNVTLS